MAEQNAKAGLSLRAYQELKSSVHQNLLSRVDLGKLAGVRDGSMRSQVLGIVQDIVANLSVPMTAGERDGLAREVLDEVFGLGPLETLLQDPTVNDILVNTYRRVYVERGGILEETDVSFKDNAHLMHIIEKIVGAVGRRVDESSPMVDARLTDGSRVNVIIPPLAIDGPILSIRRFAHIPMTAEDLLANQTMTKPMLDLLKGAVKARLSILISGGTGTGKTTFLNVLSGYISERERIITIEDSAELQLQQRHVVRLECRPPNVEGSGAVKARQLVTNSLRMRPDRIIVGEVRGEEALDMLQAMNTGHDGSLTTIHANSQRDALSRIETMVLMAGFDLPVRAIREQVASALDLVIHTARLRDGSRKVIGVSEIVGMEGDIVTMQEIVRFTQRGVDKENRVLGEFCYTGVQPVCLKRFAEYGVTYDARALNELSPLPSLW